MNPLPEIVLRRLAARLDEVAYEVTRVRYTAVRRPAPWVPSINAYRCRDGYWVCVDLAGVDQQTVDLQVEPRRLWIRGERRHPEPDPVGGPPLQVLAMEINHGAFAREIGFAEEVNPAAVQAEQCNGLLWIRLPLRPPGEA